MSEYVPSIKGYIADVPVAWFKRCDGKIFHFDEITQTNVNAEVGYTPINVGWKNYPSAYIPSTGEMTIEMTCGQFTSSLFEMANALTYQTSSEEKAFDTEGLTIPNSTSYNWLKQEYAKIDIDSIQIASLEKITEGTPDEGEFLVTEDTSFSPSLAKIELHNDVPADERGVLDIGLLDVMMLDVGEGSQHVEVSYTYTLPQETGTLAINNQDAAIGELILKWPVYSNGQDCTKAAIKGHYVLKVFRCRVTQMPGFDTSYKGASTNSVTWKAMDPKNGTKTKYTYAYIPIAA